MKCITWLGLLATLCFSPGCAVVAVADVAATTVIYGLKTTVNVLDAVTPDIVNRD